jgi:peptidyl-prolyl cis-trans isomerase A (cyclophilin A)
MLRHFKKQSAFLFASFIAAASLSPVANATIVQFQTSLGDFSVNLYDEATPNTVANFLAYVNGGDYTNTLIHRSVPGFVVQGGGFIVDESEVSEIMSRPSPINEPVFSSRRGTIAMAKLSGAPNSATNEWFFNLANNSTNLDTQNGGFTVFGEVMDSGMEVVDAIAALSRFNITRLGGAFAATPLRDFNDGDGPDFDMNPSNYFVMIENIVVLDAAIDTAKDLTPTPNTLIDQVPAPKPKKKGGAADWLSLLGLVFVVGTRRIFLKK